MTVDHAVDIAQRHKIIHDHSFSLAVRTEGDTEVGAGTHRRVAWKSCVYALLLSLFFLIFGTLILRLFGVPLSMVRIVGGMPSSSGGGMIPAGGAAQDANIAFVPLAMPLMCLSRCDRNDAGDDFDH